MAYLRQKYAVFCVFACLVALATCASPARAGVAKWQEAHQTSDDVRVVVGADGAAIVERTIKVRVVAGLFRGLDLPEIERGVVFTPDVDITAADGTHFSGHLERGAEARKSAEVVSTGAAPTNTESLRLIVDDPDKGLRRGVYVFRLSYRVDLVAAKAIDREGALWKISWTAPPSPEGRDVARVVFDLPTAPTPPRALQLEPLPGAPPGSDEATTMATVRRLPERDEIELVRPHIARGESVRWSARVDPKAFPALQAAQPRAGHRVKDPGPPAPSAARAWFAVGIGLAAVAFGLLVFCKDRDVDGSARARGARARPLIPLGRYRGLAAGLAAGLGVGLVGLGGSGTAGVLVALAALIGAHRPPVTLALPRGGSWVPLKAEDAFDTAVDPGSPVDVSTRRGKLALVALVIAVGGAAFAIWPHTPRISALTVLVGLATLPCLLTGLRSQLGARVGLGSPLLATVHAELQKTGMLVRALGRVHRGADDASEVRVWGSPEVSILGFTGVEIASVPVPTLSGRRERAEAVVRVLDGSPAHERLTALVPGAPAEPGRKLEERVFALTTARGDARDAAILVARIADVVRERRVDSDARDLAHASDVAPRTERRRPRAPVTPASRPRPPKESAPGDHGADIAPALGW